MNILTILQIALPIAAQLAVMTSTPFDDEVVTFMRAAIENPAVADWLKTLIDSGVNPHVAASTAGVVPPEHVKEALSGRIDWQKFITTTLPAVLKIISIFVK